MGEWPPQTELNPPNALTFTIVLVASSFTCQFGMFAAERGDVSAFASVVPAGLVVFVLGQANEYRNLIVEGTTLASSSYRTVFY